MPWTASACGRDPCPSGAHQRSSRSRSRCVKRGSHWVGDVCARRPPPGSPGSAQRVKQREVGRHGPVGGGWTGPLITVDVKPKSTVCRRELKQNQANSNRRPVPLPAEQPAGDGGSSRVADTALEAAVNVISGAGVRSCEFKQDGVTVSSNHVSLCISVSIIF